MRLLEEKCGTKTSRGEAGMKGRKTVEDSGNKTTALSLNRRRKHRKRTRRAYDDAGSAFRKALVAKMPKVVQFQMIWRVCLPKHLGEFCKANGRERDAEK